MPDASPATRSSELNLSSFRLSETGLTPIGTPTMEQWLDVGEFINKSQRAVHFWIGDWLNFGEKAWGERYQEAVDRTRFDVQKLRNDKWIASRIPPNDDKLPSVLIITNRSLISPLTSRMSSSRKPSTSGSVTKSSAS